MSNTQFAFIKRDSVPNRDALQASIDKLGFNLKLDPEFTPFDDCGFSPCQLNGESDIGFEIFYEPAEDVIGDNDDLKEIVKDHGYCISMVWRSSMKDCASAMIVSCALAKDFGAIISYEGEEPESFDRLLESTRAILKEAAGEA